MSIAALESIEPFPNILAERLGRITTSGNGRLRKTHVSGVSSPFTLASLFCHHSLSTINATVNLLLFPSQKELRLFQDWVQFFEPSLPLYVLPSTDVSPYSGLMPNNLSAQLRAGWLTNAQVQSRGFFLCDTRSFLQKTLPPDIITDNLIEIRSPQDLPHNFQRLLSRLGYQSTPIVEDLGSYFFRGGIFDIFPCNSTVPYRLELFGDSIELIRRFNPKSQRSMESVDSFYIGPAKEALLLEDEKQAATDRIRSLCTELLIEPSLFEEQLRSITLGNSFLGEEFFLPLFFPTTSEILDHFTTKPNVWLYDPMEISRQYDTIWAELKSEHRSPADGVLPIPPDRLFSAQEPLTTLSSIPTISVAQLDVTDAGSEEGLSREVHSTYVVKHLSLSEKGGARQKTLSRIQDFVSSGYHIFITYSTDNQKMRLKTQLASAAWEVVSEDAGLRSWSSWLQPTSQPFLRLIFGHIPESLSLSEERIILLSGDELLGRQSIVKTSDREQFNQKASALVFGDLKVGELVVHTDHGVGLYTGLKMMDIGGAQSEFIEISYKDGDKLFIPVYRVHQIQKYSGPQSQRLLDKLGSNLWQNTKVKVRAKLRDIAAELLSLYVERSHKTRPPFSPLDRTFQDFENEFPFEETIDQQKAIDSVLTDMVSDKPMDRLICGDVGFGKTEVAIRAAFKAVQDGKQVALLAPTTVLTYQHFENFRKRFANHAVRVRALNRFVEKKDVSTTIAELKTGGVDIVIGTHRLLSKDIGFKDLGLLIIDEEQRFGVLHKEKIKKMKTTVDTLTLSATPIPRTLNMSLLGLRDLSLIATPPEDRLPTRTFICRFNAEAICKSIDDEVQRGGQVFFIHNRVQGIYGVCDELKVIAPHIRFAVAHGQMDEDALEEVVVDFYNHKIDVLVCTTIIESGIDIPRANTMFIDRANTLGLSQLYQLRGRVGRSKHRAYCYLLLPRTGHIDKEAQERLKIIQENTALGSGIRVAHYDLELRGSGNLLGDDQSGHANAVGYELYLELFEDALRVARGEPEKVQIEPEINVRIPAFIPDKYIADIRTRLSYYKTLSQVVSADEIDRVEEELRDLFGPLPPETVNLLGLMLLRLTCKSLSVRDISSGAKSISLAFTEHTTISPQKVVALTLQENKKYSLTPDSRLKIRMNEMTWPRIYEELEFLQKLMP